MAILIDTVAVMAAAEDIDKVNRRIKADLSDVDEAIGSLAKNWQGGAASSGINKYDYIKRNFAEARFGVVNNLVVYMKNSVGALYDEVDKEIAAAASEFFK